MELLAGIERVEDGGEDDAGEDEAGPGCVADSLEQCDGFVSDDVRRAKNMKLVSMACDSSPALRESDRNR